MIKHLLENYLNQNFPESDLSASLLEINTTTSLTIQPNLIPIVNPLEQANIALNKALEVFNEIFNEVEPIWVLINEWNLYPADYDIDQFENKTTENCVSWISFDKTNEVDREQVFMIKHHKEINLINIFKAIINGEYGLEPQLKCRIYFINPIKDIIFIFWDGIISIKSNNHKNIKSICEKFAQSISKHSLTAFYYDR